MKTLSDFLLDRRYNCCYYDEELVMLLLILLVLSLRQEESPSFGTSEFSLIPDFGLSEEVMFGIFLS